MSNTRASTKALVDAVHLLREACTRCGIPYPNAIVWDDPTQYGSTVSNIRMRSAESDAIQPAFMNEPDRILTIEVRRGSRNDGGV